MPDLRANEYMVVRAQGAADVISGDMTNLGFRGVVVFLQINALSGTSGTAEDVTVTIQGKDPVGGVYYNILVSAAITATGLIVLRVYPGLTAAANLTVSDVLPPTWRITSVIQDDGDQAYDIDVSFAYIP